MFDSEKTFALQDKQNNTLVSYEGIIPKALAYHQEAHSAINIIFNIESTMPSVAFVMV